MRSGNTSLYSSSSKKLKTKKACPNRSSWKIWSKCMELFAQSIQLKILLTKWSIPTPKQKQKWPTYIVLDQLCIYVRQATGFIQCTELSNNHKLYIHGITSQWTPTDNAYPVHTTSVDGAKTWICRNFHTDTIQPTTPIITTFESYLKKLEP